MFFDALRRSPNEVEGTIRGDLARGYIYSSSDTPNNFSENVAFAVYWTVTAPLVGATRALMGDMTPVPYRELAQGWPTETIDKYIEMHPITKTYTTIAATVESLPLYILFAFGHQNMMNFGWLGKTFLGGKYEKMYNDMVNMMKSPDLRKTLWDRIIEQELASKHD